MSSSVRSITVSNASIDTTIANIDTYAVSFEIDYDLTNTANIVGIQSFVFTHKAEPNYQQSVVKVQTDGSCKLLQTHANLDSTPVNITTNNVYTYLVTLINNGTTAEPKALNQTMKTVTKLT